MAAPETQLCEHWSKALATERSQPQKRLMTVPVERGTLLLQRHPSGRRSPQKTAPRDILQARVTRERTRREYGAGTPQPAMTPYSAPSGAPGQRPLDPVVLEQTFGQTVSDHAKAWYPTFHRHTEHAVQQMMQDGIIDSARESTVFTEYAEDVTERSARTGRRSTYTRVPTGCKTGRSSISLLSRAASTPLIQPTTPFHLSILSDKPKTGLRRRTDDPNWWRQKPLASKEGSGHWTQDTGTLQMHATAAMGKDEGAVFRPPAHGINSNLVPRGLQTINFAGKLKLRNGLYSKEEKGY